MKRLHVDTIGNRSEENGIKQLKYSSGMFKSCIFSLLPTGIGHTRCKLLASQIKANDGKISSSINQSTTHLIVDDSLVWEAISKIIRDIDITSLPYLKILKSKWLSQCIKEKTVLPTESFEIKPEIHLEMLQANDPIPEVEETKMTTSVVNSSTAMELKSSSEIMPVIPSHSTRNVTGKWVCSYSSADTPVNHNKHITDKLQMMAETYRNSKDQWRAYGYDKAINALKTWPKEISSLEEAISVPGIGMRLAEKIWEIVESGSLHKLEVTNLSENFKALNLFAQVWGAGPTTAQTWVQQGFRTLDDLTAKAKLTNQQQIGIKHYYDLLEKMPREEAGEIVQKVKDVALGMKKDLQVIGCGSFRRGRPMCGDVDILITHPDGKSQAGLLNPIVEYLTKCGFLTDHLVNPEHAGAHQTYMGICYLPGPNQKHRRLDLFVVPASEYGPALLAYTGSGHFNRSMRLLARKKGMALSHMSLRAGVIRKGSEKVFDGHPLPTPTEESIFHHLGLEYRPPEERDH